MTLLSQIKRHEGFRGYVYLDSEGIQTVGYGHNLERPMSEELASRILAYDLEQATKSARTLTYFDDLNDPRQDAVVNMIFNLGLRGFLGFKRMNAALFLHNYDLAAKEALDSKWAVQVGDRARELAAQIKNGEYAS